VNEHELQDDEADNNEDDVDDADQDDQENDELEDDTDESNDDLLGCIGSSTSARHYQYLGAPHLFKNLVNKALSFLQLLLDY